MPRLAWAIRHVHFEDCGTLTDALLERNFAIRYIDVGHHVLQDLDVADSGKYPWILEELALFERALALGKPIIGICLGAQMLAHVLGARVYPGPVQELGWKPLTLTPAGRNSVVSGLGGESTSMLHWHGDTFDLPQGAVLLASTQEVAQQIFEWQNTLAFQCHPELRARDFERWLIGHSCEIEATAGASVVQLREQTASLAPVLAQKAARVFNDWLGLT
jgi:GMP synthase (glutamine-hydrolysing)